MGAWPAVYFIFYKISTGNRCRRAERRPNRRTGEKVTRGRAVETDLDGDLFTARSHPPRERADAFAYTGSVELVRIEPGTQAPDSYANLPERETQR
jgi:hypothetical protein